MGANEIVAPYWGFFSTGHFAGHERKFGQDFKDIFSELYREFESRLVRHPYSAPRFLHRWMGRKSPVNWGISIAATVLEIAELRHFSLGDGIFLRSFVLCGFSIVSKSEVPEGQLETKFAPSSNPGWMSERN